MRSRLGFFSKWRFVSHPFSWRPRVPTQRAFLQHRSVPSRVPFGLRNPARRPRDFAAKCAKCALLLACEGLSSYVGARNARIEFLIKRAMLTNLSRLKQERAARWQTRLLRVWNAMDHPDGKCGLSFNFNGNRVTVLHTLSPKKATCAILFASVSAFVLGTSIGLGAFIATFSVQRDVQIRVLHAALIGMSLMYLLVVLTIIHLVFYRDARAMSFASGKNKQNENESDDKPRNRNTSNGTTHTHSRKLGAAASS